MKLCLHYSYVLQISFHFDEIFSKKIEEIPEIQNKSGKNQESDRQNSGIDIIAKLFSEFYCNTKKNREILFTFKLQSAELLSF